MVKGWEWFAMFVGAPSKSSHTADYSKSPGME